MGFLLFLLLVVYVSGVAVVEVGSGAVTGGMKFHGADRVEIFYACGVGSVSNFGVCKGECLGFVAALSGDWSRLNITIGGAPAVVLHAVEYRISDVYQPRLYVVVFRGRGVGEVKISGLSRLEAYLLANFGVGRLQNYEFWFMPFVAGREHNKPFNVTLSVGGDFVACTVGKYARAVYSEKGPAEGTIGYYYGLFKGVGSNLSFHWERIDQSAVKLMFIVATAPFFHVAQVVGADGSPVPAPVLRALVKRGVVLGDGRVGFEDFGLIEVGGQAIRLMPNSTVSLPGRRCVITASTSLGTPIPLSVYYGNVLVASGSGAVRTYCIDGAYSVAYNWRREGAVSFSLSGRSEGNVTIPSTVVRFVALNIFRMPAASAEEEVPAGLPVRLNLAEFSGEVMATGSVVEVSKYPLYTPEGAFALAFTAVAIALKPFKGRVRLIYEYLFLLAAFAGVADLLRALAWGAAPSTLTAYVLTALPLIFLALEVPWIVWQFAIPFAAMAALYGLFAASFPTVSTWRHLIWPVIVLLVFWYSLKLAKQWYCGVCTRGYQLGAPQLYLLSFWSKALSEGEGQIRVDLEKRLGRLEGVTDLTQRLNCLRALVFKEVGRAWDEECGYVFYNPVCLYLEGMVGWRGYRSLRAFMLGEGGAEACEKALRSLGMNQFAPICRGQ